MSDGFSLEFETDNAAFEGQDMPLEIARILRELAEHVEEGRTGRWPVRDISGNKIGYSFVPEPEEEESDEDEDEDEDEESDDDED